MHSNHLTNSYKIYFTSNILKFFLKFPLSFLSNLFNDCSISFQNSPTNFQVHWLCKVFMNSVQNFLGISLKFLKLHSFINYFSKLVKNFPLYMKVFLEFVF